MEKGLFWPTVSKGRVQLNATEACQQALCTGAGEGAWEIKLEVGQDFKFPKPTFSDILPSIRPVFLNHPLTMSPTENQVSKP